ncbi:BsuPI-related putative proteinase inhibitor [Neobacillus sp. DY30]|uniref:BsuPI-related putative proteinase inhibitor n=1 Tax=Neobacillus sp. DY30 TaxID=3047871 RepID=UPI0024BFBA4A|nr:BsuPI-related putative proteinase inhibitor [Neobacillus sp. DY30]WHX98620.1 BsuPI-related putative proteinase inhibitor [Neobacillus sp. DY30]
MRYKILMILLAGFLSACGTGNQTNGNGEVVKKEKQSHVAANVHPTIEIKEENNSTIINYKVKNISGGPLKLSFASGLQADYIVYDEEGEKVKQYSEEVMSTQAITEMTFNNNEELQNSFTISDLYNGIYKIEVFLTAEEEKAKVVMDLLVEKSLFTKDDGVYTGQIDPHSIEVDMNGEKVAFQLKEEAIQQLTALKEGSEISFVYTDNDIQKTIEKFLLD